MLEIQAAALYYSEKLIFKEIDVRLAAGRWLALLGTSGVGKTSLLRLIAGLQQTRPQLKTRVEGWVLWQGKADFSVAYMAQQDGLLPWLSVLENVLLSFRLRKQPLPREKAQHLLAEVGLMDVMRATPAALSGGMRQRVALIRTLMQDAPLVLMDEPFSALDAITRLEMQDLASRLLRAAAKTVVLVTHDPLEALRLADEIKVMRGDPVHIQDYQPPKLDAWATGYEDLLSLLRSPS